MTQVTKKEQFINGIFFYSLKNLILVLLQSHVNLIAKPFIELKDYKMKKNLTIILVILLYSCGGDSPTNPSSPSIDYHADDNSFITELVNSNAIEMDSLNSRITTITTDGKDRIKTMDLSNLGLEILPENIINLAYLEELDLSNNLFSDFPSELCEVSNQLSTLIIEKNLLCDPTSITHCVMGDITVDFKKQNCTLIKETQEMDFLLKFIKDNNLDSISSTIFDDIEWSWVGTDSALTSDGKQIERIIEIRWIGQNITNIPGSIKDLEYLERLELEDNKLESLPPEMKFLDRLLDLQLQNNELLALPSKIGLMTNLEKLNVRGNQLIELPESIGLLANLTELNVGHNQLEMLSDTLCGLISSELSNINIECNQLDSSKVSSCLFNELGDQGDHPNCSGN